MNTQEKVAEIMKEFEKKCVLCNKIIQPKIKANNIKYCSLKCRNKSYYVRTQKEWGKRKREKDKMK